MKKVIAQIAVLLLCLLMITESAGVIVFVHTCYSSNTRDITPFPGNKSCCCATAEQTSAQGTSGIHDKCCRNQQYYVKAAFSGFPVFLKKIATDNIILISDIFRENKYSEQASLASFVPWLDHSPPLTGKDFIYSVHQIRIPYPAC